MAAKFEIRHADRGLLGQTQVRAEFKYDCYAYFYLSGAAEVTTTDAFVRAVQTWTAVRIITYFFNSETVASSPISEQWLVTGAYLQLHSGPPVEFLPEDGEALTVLIDGQTLIIAASDGQRQREVLREATTKIAALRLERVCVPKQVQNKIAVCCGMPQPITLVAE